MCIVSVKAMSGHHSADDDLKRSFRQVFPRDTKTHSPISMCVKLFAYLLPSVGVSKLPQFLQYFHAHITDPAYSLHTQSSAFVMMNNVARQKRPEVLALVKSVFRLSKDDMDRVRSHAQKRIEQNNRHVLSFRQALVEQVIRKLESIPPEKQRPKFLIILTMLQSGMRMVEALKLARISPAHDQHHISVSNLAKTKDKAFTIVKPLLFTTYDKFASQLRTLRNCVMKGKAGSKISNKELTNRYNHSVNTEIAKLLGPKCTSHTARKIYGSLSYKMYGHTQNMSLNAWLEHVLGHQSITTSLSYSNVQVVE